MFNAKKNKNTGIQFDGSKASLYARANAAYCTEFTARKKQDIRSYSVTSNIPEAPDPGFFATRKVRRG